MGHPDFMDWHLNPPYSLRWLGLPHLKLEMWGTRSIGTGGCLCLPRFDMHFGVFAARLRSR
jgi:hypothetical protein